MRVSVARVLEMLAEFTGVSVSEITGTSRIRFIAEARQAAMIVMRDRMNLSYPHIAKVFGHRHHSTVWYACNKDQSDSVRAIVKDINWEIDRMLAEYRRVAS